MIEQMVVMAREPLLRKEDLPQKIVQGAHRKDVMELPVGPRSRKSSRPPSVRRSP